MRQAIINSAIKNLRQFGYPNVTPENIITDEVYSQFFKSMLNDNLGVSKASDTVIKELITEIDKNK